MFKQIKKILFIIPLFLMAFLVVQSHAVRANEKLEIKHLEKSGDYYFAIRDDIVEIYSPLPGDNDSGKFSIGGLIKNMFSELPNRLEYRVIFPKSDGGKRYATKWITEKPNNKGTKDPEYGIFKINFSSLVAEEIYLGTDLNFDVDATHYIEIKYFDLVGKHIKKYDHNLKIVYNTVPPVIRLAKTSPGHVQIEIETASVVKEAYLLYTNQLGAITTNNFKAAYKAAQAEEKDDIFNYIIQGDGAYVANVPGDSYKYVYVFSMDANGYADLNVIDMTTNVVTPPDEDYVPPGVVDTPSQWRNLLSDSGDVILIILLVVLAISTSLIVAQKINDRKRLY